MTTKRKLKRQLNLGQVIMLGTAGTLAAEIFVLTGHAAGMAGPGAVLALLIGGLLSYSVALNYAELATTYPVAGGAMSYVREAYGNGILSFLVGSMDAMSSTFYAALSAVGFAYSLQVLLPFMPIVPTAVVVISLFALLNILGATQVGRIQVLLGGVLLAVFAIFIVAGFLSPNGFRWNTLVSGETIFIGESIWHNLALMLGTIALVYNAYVGFEVIADDAEEVTEPSRNIPIGILISLTLCTLIYVAVATVTLGTVPWQELAGSETALTDAVRHFLPTVGVPMMGLAGMVATLTSINTAMLSATREAFSLSRDGVWPRPLARLSRFRTPYVAILVVGGISALIAVIGFVDFLSYISSAGYLFVLFWGSLSMIRLRKRFPNIARPFKAPFFPLTTYLAGASCLLIIAFADWRALLFGGGILIVFALAYYLSPIMSRLVLRQVAALGPSQDLFIVAAGNSRTARSLVHLGSILAQASEDAYMCVLSVEPRPNMPKERLLDLILRPSPAASEPVELPVRRRSLRERYMLGEVANEALMRNVALYTKSRSATSVAQGILDEIVERDNVKLVLAGWPTPLDSETLSKNVVKQLIQKAPTNVAVLLDRGLTQVKHVLVPVGSSPHSRMALRLAHEIAVAENAEVLVLRVAADLGDSETLEDRYYQLEEFIQDVLGSVPPSFGLRIVETASVLGGILAESTRRTYGLIVIGASEQWASRDHLFGVIGDRIATMASCSVLLCRRHESLAMARLRHSFKSMEREAQAVDVEAISVPVLKIDNQEQRPNRR